LDIGSGVGHLARFLHYGLNFTVACLEAESEFNSSAERFDMDLKIAVENMGKTPRRPPLHVVCRLTSNTDIETLHKVSFWFKYQRMPHYIYIYIFIVFSSLFFNEKKLPFKIIECCEI